MLLSNAPRMPDAVEEQFRRIGVATDFYDAIVTSGAATREDLIPRGPLSLYYIGTDWDPTLLAGLSVTRTGIEDAEPRSASGSETISPRARTITPVFWPRCGPAISRCCAPIPISRFTAASSFAGAPARGQGL